jgi:hypothetical protein
LVDGSIIVNKKVDRYPSFVEHLLACGGREAHIPMVYKIADLALRASRIIIVMTGLRLKPSLLRPEYKFVPLNRVEFSVVYDVIGVVGVSGLMLINLRLPFCPQAPKGGGSTQAISRNIMDALPFLDCPYKLIIKIFFSKPAWLPSKLLGGCLVVKVFVHTWVPPF